MATKSEEEEELDEDEGEPFEAAQTISTKAKIINKIAKTLRIDDFLIAF